MNKGHKGPVRRGFGLAVIGLILAGFGPAVRPAGGAPVPREKPEREVPLKEIYSTAHQEGLRQIPFREGEAGYKALTGIQNCVEKCQLQTLFLAHGDDPGAALWDAWHRLTWVTEREERRAREAREKSTRSWLVLFLGIAPSTPNQFTIRSVEIYQGRVQVVYDTSERKESAAADACHYLYLIPLGELKKGSCTLELVELPLGHPVLMRRDMVGDLE